MEDGITHTEKLLKSIFEDNRLAFNKFYELYYEQVFRFAYYFLKETDACKEVVTDTFFSIWQSRYKLKDIGKLETYLFIAVRNEATRYRNREHRTGYSSINELPVNEIAPQEESAENQLIFEEMEELLGRIIEGLPEKCRLIFFLARHEGLKPKEIAERLSITESTVRVQMKIAVGKIVEKIKPYYPDITFSFLLSYLLSNNL